MRQEGEVLQSHFGSAIRHVSLTNALDHKVHSAAMTGPGLAIAPTPSLHFPHTTPA
jgi:hypothetical protein